MNWGSWSEFWLMGEQGLYVWSAYLVTFAVVVSEIVVLAISRRSILEHLGRFTRNVRKSGHPAERDSIR
jgi:heme exporter protein D